MKKYFIILAAAALAFSASCTKVSTNDTPARKVTFAAANYVPQTKAGEVSFLSEFADPSTAHFNCKGFLHAEGITTTQDFFGENGETISWNATAHEWAPSHDYYWPKGASSYVNFVSWYDTGAGPTTATETSLQWSNRTIGSGDNIMYADEAWRFKDNDHDQFDKDGVTEGVPTLFRHALAQLQIRARASKVSRTSPNVTWTITIEDASIASIYNTGSLSLTNADPNTANTIVPWTGNWATSGTAGNQTIANKTLTNANQDLVAVQSVLPQALSTVLLNFKVRIISTYAGTPAVTHEELITKSIPFYAASGDALSNSIDEWAKNTRYIYTIVVEPSENRVLFDPASEAEWVVNTVAETTI